MPAAGLIALLDDIASVLDDVALLTKVAAKKTAGVLGDDLALNAEQVAGVQAARELPVVWAVAKGSLVNKAILVPAALAISAVVPWLVTPLLMLGGSYLCFEGSEKLAHKLLHGKAEAAHAESHAGEASSIDPVALEKEKVKGAIRTDFVLSAEIVTIALGTVATAEFLTRVWVLSGISVLMTAGVYGLVAGIVKLDDLGGWLTRKADQGGTGVVVLRGLGLLLLRSAPLLMKALSVAGTIAMFLVGGGILLHGIPTAHALVHHLSESGESPSLVERLLALLLPACIQLLVGVVAGTLVLAAVMLAKRLRGGGRAISH
jgi:predicted DNA repair protein MutK